MVIDTSAVIAILQHEPEAETLALAIERAKLWLMSAVSVLEATILSQARKGDQGVAELDTFIPTAGIVVVPFDLTSSPRRAPPSAGSAEAGTRRG